MRIETVSPKIWNVIEIGINIPPFGGGQTARLHREPQGFKRTTIILPDQSKIVNPRRMVCPLDKSEEAGIIKITQGPATSGIASD